MLPMSSPRQPPVSFPPDPLYQQLDPEACLLFLASRVDSSTDVDTQVVEIARTVVDWNKVVTLGDLNRVQPLLYRTLRRCGVQGIPERTFRALKGQVAITAMRNEGAVEELACLQRRFDERGLRVLHYKGATVALRFYGELNLRTFHDMDFLIEAADIDVVGEVLETSGYTNSERLTERELELHEAEQKEFLFQKRGFNVEPHWKFTPRRFEFDIDYAGIWRRASFVDVGEVKLLVPATEDGLVLMMLVGAAGFWKRLQMLADIAAVANGPNPVNWAAVELEMNRLRATKVLHVAALLANLLCGANIPVIVLDAARRDSAVVGIARQATKTMADAELSRAAADTLPWKFQWLLWGMRDDWRDRLVYLFRTLTTPTSLHTRRMPLPRFLTGLYVFLVPVHDYLLVPAFQLLRGNRTK